MANDLAMQVKVPYLANARKSGLIIRQDRDHFFDFFAIPSNTIIPLPQSSSHRVVFLHQAPESGPIIIRENRAYDWPPRYIPRNELSFCAEALDCIYKNT